MYFYMFGLNLYLYIRIYVLELYFEEKSIFKYFKINKYSYINFLRNVYKLFSNPNGDPTVLSFSPAYH